MQDEELDALMACLADGDRQAFTPVFRRLWDPVLRVCTSMLKNSADAADAAQQAMTKILERASDYEPGRPALPWALAIASWECRTILRKKTRRRETSASHDAEAADETAEHEVAQRELAEAAAQALGELSEADRQTLVAAFWEEATQAQGRGAALRKRRQRALERLRKVWRRLYGLG